MGSSGSMNITLPNRQTEVVKQGGDIKLQLQNVYEKIQNNANIFFIQYFTLSNI